jgi:hypothetical protein
MFLYDYEKNREMFRRLQLHFPKPLYQILRLTALSEL